jgi:hypothetical protein
MGRWKDNIRTDFKEFEWEVVDWIYLAQDRDKWWAFVNMVMYFCVPRKTGELIC